MRLQMTLQCVDHTTEVPELLHDLEKLPPDGPVQIRVDGKLWLCRLVSYEEKP